MQVPERRGLRLRPTAIEEDLFGFQEIFYLGDVGAENR
jgi:hypothetical protein